MTKSEFRMTKEETRMASQFRTTNLWLIVVILPLVCGLGCLGDMNPGADGPAKTPPKPPTAVKPSPYAVPDYPETTKSDPPATPTEKPVLETPTTEKPATPPAVVTSTEKPAEVKPTETAPQTPATAPATTPEAKGPFKDDPFPNGEPVSKDEPKKDVTPEQ
jgi:hypothetical protein